MEEQSERINDARRCQSPSSTDVDVEETTDSLRSEDKGNEMEVDLVSDTSTSTNGDSSCKINDSVSSGSAPGTFVMPAPLSLSVPTKKVKDISHSESSATGDSGPDQKQVDLKVDISSRNSATASSGSKLAVPLPYKEPEWSGVPEEDEDYYSFEVLKNGKIIDTFPLENKSYFVFGRLPSCDITLEHPSLSRYHTVIQYSKALPTHEKGWYIYDLDSTHGTWVNKRKLSPNVYYRLKVGHVVKFGGSTRLYILQGPVADQEEESEMSMTEMKEQREKLKREAEVLKQMELEAERQRQEAQQKLLENRGCGWGMGEDAEDDANEENPFASLVPENESLYIDDPKKALKGFYEREGCDLPDYQFTEVAMGKHKCVLDLPVDGPNGEELVAEVVVSGKRKDAVIACALEACRMLDKLGMLRSSKHESRKRKQKKWEDDDFYDSDEDTFLDRTGTIEKKRFMRMKKAGKDEAETYESLMEKYNKVVAQIQDTESQLEKAKAEADARVSEDIDELDAYMNSIKSGAMDTKTRMRLKGDLLRLRVEEQKLRKLVNIAQPASLPPLKQPSAVPVKPPAADSLSRKLHAQQKLQKKGPPVKTAQQTEFEQKPDDFEEQDEEEEEGENTHISDKTKESSAKKPSSSPTSSSKFENVQTNEKKISRNNVQTSKTAVKGPTLPPKDVSKKSRERHANVMSTAAVLNAEKAQQKISKSYEENDPDYAMWLPPEEQSGDGRTSLNDKLGY